MILRIKLLLAMLIYSPLLYLYRKSNNRAEIDKDVDLWCQELRIPKDNIFNLVLLLMLRPQFRNLFFYRTKCHSRLMRHICPPDSTISIADDCGEIVGGGLYFEHAFLTRLGVNHIGKNCRLRQLTTLGVKSKNRHNERPWIGDNVDFGVNVTCIGNITIGDNAIIAAGSVVVKDVPPNAIVAGNPAKVIKYRTENTIN